MKHARIEAAPPAVAWHVTLQARAILAECAATPPQGEWQRIRYVLTADEWYSYTGPLAERLHAIRDDIGAAAVAYGDLTGDYGPVHEWCATPTVDAAIDAAVVTQGGA